jgi:hypothetical protein
VASYLKFLFLVGPVRMYCLPSVQPVSSFYFERHGQFQREKIEAAAEEYGWGWGGGGSFCCLGWLGMKWEQESDNSLFVPKFLFYL